MANTHRCFNMITIAILWLLISSASHCAPLLPAPNFSTKDTTPIPNASLLVDETFQRGIFVQHSQQSHGLHGLDDTLGSGACVLDMDNDGDLDIYFVAGSGATRFYGKKHWWSDRPKGQLYRNNGNGRFKLVTDNTGLPDNLWGMGCNSADIDNDGFEDLILSNRGENWIAYGNGQGLFTSLRLGKTSLWSTSVSLADINNDGLLDIYIGNYIQFQKNTKTFESASGFSGDNIAFSPQNFSAQANELYINTGNRTFTEQSQKYNLLNADGRTLGAQWLDSNNDSWLDLLVMNDEGSEPQLFTNQQGTAFKRAPLQQQIDSLGALHNTTTFTLQSNSVQPISIYSSGLGFAPYLLRKSKNRHINLTWNAISGPNKLENMSHWGVASGDFNGDGLDDLYLGAGLAYPDSDAHRLPQGQPDTLLLQTKTGKLLAQANPSSPALSTRAVISADIDNDGDSDLFLTHNNGPAQLKINHSNPKHWIGLDIRNQFGLRNHYKKIEAKQSEKSTWLHPISDGFLSNQDYRQHPSLLNDSNVSVTVYWIDGTHSDYTDLQPNQYHLLSQNKDPQSLPIQIIIEELATPLALAHWQIKAKKVNWSGVLLAFSNADTAHKIALLQEANVAENHALLLAFIEISLNQNISLNNLTEVLKIQELEISLPLILRQMQTDLSCKTAEMVYTWFNEEEAMLLSKDLFTRPLIRQLKHASPTQKICILFALSKSRQFRPVAAVEEVLITSKDNKVRKAALYTLGELRRTRSIAVVKPLLKDPFLAKNAEIALKKLQSQHLVATPQPISFQQEILPTTSRTTNTATCFRMKAKKALKLPDRQLATLISLCSPSALRSWLSSNKAQLMSNINKVINNPYLSGAQLEQLLQTIKSDDIKGFDLLLLGLLNSTNGQPKKSVILKAMTPYSTQNSIQTAATHILENSQLSQALRIAAGDLLIDHKPALVIKHSGSIFNE
jgi:hypothetical protein